MQRCSWCKTSSIMRITYLEVVATTAHNPLDALDALDGLNLAVRRAAIRSRSRSEGWKDERATSSSSVVQPLCVSHGGTFSGMRCPLQGWACFHFSLVLLVPLSHHKRLSDDSFDVTRKIMAPLPQREPRRWHPGRWSATPCRCHRSTCTATRGRWCRTGHCL